MKKVIFTLSTMLLFVATSWSQAEIQGSDCGITLTSMTQNIFSVNVPGANRYEFRLQEGGNTYTLERNSTAFRPELIPTLNYGTTYSVDVRSSADNGATWTNFGTACNVTTMSATGITTAADGVSFTCGGTLGSFTNNIFVNEVPNAANYEYRFTEQGTGIVVSKVRQVPVIRGSLVPGLQYNTTYDMDVRWQQADGTWSNYGATCEINTPTTSVILDANCGTTLPDMSTNVFSSQIAGAAHYKFRLEDLTPNSTTVIEVVRPNNWIRPNLVPGILYGTSYSITTALEITPGVYGDFDNNPCTITTPTDAGVTTALTTSDCAVGTLTSMNQNLFATAVTGAVLYEFKWTEVSTSTDFFRTRTTPVIRGTLMNGVSYDQTYVISVRWQQADGTWSNFGSTCTISSPSAAGLLSAIDGGDCGSTFGPSQTIYATAIPSAAAYEFRFTDGPAVYTRVIGSNYVKPSQVVGLVDGTYSVDVRWKQANGTWSSYGSACSLTVNSAPSFVLNDKPNTDDVLVDNKSTLLNATTDFEVSAYPNPTAAETIITGTTAITNIEVYTMAGQLVYRITPNANQTSIDMTSFENGIYVVKAASNNDVKVLRVVKR